MDANSLDNRLIPSGSMLEACTLQFSKPGLLLTRLTVVIVEALV